LGAALQILEYRFGGKYSAVQVQKPLKFKKF